MPLGRVRWYGAAGLCALLCAAIVCHCGNTTMPHGAQPDGRHREQSEDLAYRPGVVHGNGLNEQTREEVPPTSTATSRVDPESEGQLTRTATVRGSALDVSTGAVIGQLRLELRRVSDGRWLGGAITDGNGEFCILFPLKSGDGTLPVAVSVSAPALAGDAVAPNRAWVSWMRPTADGVLLRVTTQSVQVRGRVVDCGGLGLPGVTVEAKGGERVESDAGGEFRVNCACWGGRALVAYGFVPETGSLAGRFAEISVGGDEMACGRIEGVLLRWCEGQKPVRVIVLSDKGPVASARCSVMGGAGELLTDAEGVAVVPRLLPGALQMDVGAAGYLVETVRVAEGVENYQVELQSAFDLMVQAIDSHQSPISGAAITAGSSLMKVDDIGIFVTDEHGMAAIPVSSRVVCLLVDAGVRGFRECVLYPAGSSSGVFQLVLEPGVVLDGRVIDESGRPVGGAIVTATRVDVLAGHPQVQQCGVDGEFQFTCAAAGSYRVRAARVGFRDALQSVEPGHECGDIMLSPAGCIRVRIRDERELRPVESDVDIRVCADGVDGRGPVLERARLRVSSDGLITVPVTRLEPGAYCVLHVTSVLGASGEVRAVVGGAGDQATVEVRLLR